MPKCDFNKVALQFKAKTLISLCRIETTQATIFSIDSKNVLAFKTIYTISF